MARPEPRIILAVPFPLGNVDSQVTTTIPQALSIGGLLLPRVDLLALSSRVFVQLAARVASPNNGLLELWLALVRDDGSVEDLRETGIHQVSNGATPTTSKQMGSALDITARIQRTAFPVFQLVGRVSAGLGVMEYPTLLYTRRP